MAAAISDYLQNCRQGTYYLKVVPKPKMKYGLDRAMRRELRRSRGLYLYRLQEYSY